MTAPQLARYFEGRGVVNASNLNTFNQTCDTVAQLRAFTGVQGLQVYMRGYVAANDGGQGQFYWNPSATGPDDGTSIIVPAGTAIGAWIRLSFDTSLNNPVTPEQFGAIGNGIANDGPALVLFSKYLYAAPNRSGLLRGVYRVARKLAPAFTNSFQKEGAITIINPNQTTLLWDGGVILMDNLNPSTGLGDQSHGIVVRSLNQRSSGFYSVGQMHVEWKTKPSSRSIGDGIRLYGYPSDTQLGSAGDGLISNITLDTTYVKWAPQAGLIALGISDFNNGSHTAYETLADCYHHNASRRMRTNSVVGIRAGDDVCPFVTYYDPTVVEQSPGIGPYNQPSLGQFSNYQCWVGAVIGEVCSANGVRFAGTYQTRVDYVYANACITSFYQDAGLIGGINNFQYQQSMGCSVGKAESVNCSEGLAISSFNTTINVDPAMFWVTDTQVENYYSLNCTSTSLLIGKCSGPRLGRLYLNGAPLAVSGFLDLGIERLELLNVVNNSVIAAYTNNVAFGSPRPTTNLTIGEVITNGASLEFHDITGFTLGSMSSTNSPRNGFYFQNLSDGSHGTLNIRYPNRLNAPTAINGVAYVPGQRIVGAGINILTDSNPIAAVTMGGGSSAANIATDLDIGGFNMTTAIASVDSLIVAQGGTFAATNFTIQGTYTNADGVLRYALYGNYPKGPTSARPTNVIPGAYFFDTTLNSPIFRNAANGGWVNGIGTAV